MSKSITCADLDLGIECAFVAEGQTNDEVIQKLFMHAEAAHPEEMRALSEEEKTDLRDQLEDTLEDAELNDS